MYSNAATRRCYLAEESLMAFMYLFVFVPPTHPPLSRFLQRNSVYTRSFYVVVL